MPDSTELRHGDTISDTDIGVHEENPDTASRAERLRQAIRQGGGNKVVSDRSGVPKTTLDGYLRGGELKLSNAVALAAATGVRLQWLATGDGPMRDSATPAPDDPQTFEEVQALIAQGRTDHPFFSTIPGQLALHSATRPQAASKLFQVVKLDRLQRAYAAARTATGGHDERMLLRFTLLIYDDLTEAEETAENRASEATAQPAPAGESAS